MTFDQFRTSLSEPAPPAGLSPALLGLWLAGKGDWDRAHRTVQDDPGAEATWVHAHLHKQEGDLCNARYWYARSPANTLGLSLKEEWEHIARSLLSES